MTLLAAGLPRCSSTSTSAPSRAADPARSNLRQAGVAVTVIGKRWRADPYAFWRLVRHVAAVRPDLVHTWLLAANAYGYAAARACGVRRIIAAQRCVDPWKGWAELAVDRYVARHCDCVVANSAGVRDFYAARGLPAERIRVIPNGVAPAPATNATRGQILAELGLPENSRLIGLVGRLWPQKRVKDAIWAADLLKVIRDDVHLLVIGDGPHRGRLLHFRDQVRIGDKVHFLGEPTTWPDGCRTSTCSGPPAVTRGNPTRSWKRWRPGSPWWPRTFPARETGRPRRDRLSGRGGTSRGFRPLDESTVGRRRVGASAGPAGRQRAGREFSVEAMVSRYVELYREILAADVG